LTNPDSDFADSHPMPIGRTPAVLDSQGNLLTVGKNIFNQQSISKIFVVIWNAQQPQGHLV